MTEANPLLNLDPASELPFSSVRAEHVRPGLETLLERARKAIANLAVDAGAPTWEGIFEGLEQATEPLEIAYALVTHLESVRTTPEFREAYNAVKPEVSAFFASISLDEGLFARLQELSEADGTELSEARARALERTLDSFRRHGAGLGSEDKAKLQDMTRDLAALTARFGQNVLDATSAWTHLVEDEKQLAGLPESARRGARAAAEAAGLKGWQLSLHAPSLVPALTYLDDRGLREKIYRAYYARASGGEQDNGTLAGKILALRRQQAELLGYDNFADFILEPRMAGDGASARAFVRELAEKTRPAFERETEELDAFRKEQGDGVTPLEPWDVAYWAEKLRRERYDFDEEELRPWFEVQRVMSGLFEIAERLYGLRIVEDERAEGWHPEVRAFRVLEGDELLGRFLTDLHPREDKRGGAWMHGLSSGVLRGSALDRPHFGLFAANLTASVGGRPALLTHDEVQTIFHEFGHLLHHLLSRTEVRSQAGTRVAWDFVELPSQIMENWCWSRPALDLFARHVETGEPIPESLFEKMKAARTFRSATAMMRQLGFAEVDLALHLDFDASSGHDPVRFSRGILEAYAPVAYYEGWAFLNGFTHLFASATGYAAGYYSYKWAEVLDADAFGRFEREGVLSHQVGQAFRQEVLERGDSVAPERAFESFMGRPPRVEALLERSGLVSA
ncbi:MAG: M3 family metallopeptidase [Myxococcota bacterium]